MVEMATIVYVLCPSEDTLAEATRRYAEKPWAKPILLPQYQPYLESFMYTNFLMTRHAEWKDAAWVGCIAHSAHLKQPMVDQIESVCERARAEESDFIALLYRGDPLVSTAEKWHPGFTRAWLALWESIGWRNKKITMSDEIPSFYCNYWITTPRIMEEYCTLMRYVDQRIRESPQLREVVCVDSGYHHRGTEIAKIPDERRMALFGVPWYPMYIFILERMICPFSLVYAKKMCLVR